MQHCLQIVLLAATVISLPAGRAASGDATSTGELRIRDLTKPSVGVARQGRLLILTYKPPEPNEGQSADPRGQSPAFTIYAGQEKIASGRFEYG